jgi:hypothetical protein
MLTIDRRALRPAHAPPASPQSRKGKQGSILAQREPRRGLAGLRAGVLAERRRRDKAAIPDSEPVAPVRTRDVADIGDRLAAKLGGPGMPQRAMTSSRSPSALLRTIGASWSGKIPRNDSPPNPRFDPPQVVAARFWRTRNQQFEYNPATCSGRSFDEKPQLSQSKSTTDRPMHYYLSPCKRTSHSSSQSKLRQVQTNNNLTYTTHELQ